MKLLDLSEARKLRRKLRMSQTELARLSGVSQSLIARMESGRVDPGYTKMLAIIAALENAREKAIPASSVMSRRVYGVEASDAVGKAVFKMKKHGISQMPVFEGGRVVGSLSESAIVSRMASGADLKELSKKRVSCCMEDPLPTVSPNTPVAAVSMLLETSPAVIVAERGNAAGIITKADLLGMLRR